MQVEIKQGGDGVACWNAAAIAAYAATIDTRETGLAAANPDLVVTPGRIKCYGCQVNDFGLGIRCTAELTRSLYSIADEVAPRVADAAGSLAEIPDLRPRIDADDAVPLTVEPTPVADAAPVTPAASPTTSITPPVPPVEISRRSGLGRLLGRRG